MLRVIFILVIQLYFISHTFAQKSIYDGVKSSPYVTEKRKKPCKDNQKNCVDHDPTIPIDDEAYIILGIGLMIGSYFLYFRNGKPEGTR